MKCPRCGYDTAPGALNYVPTDFFEHMAYVRWLMPDRDPPLQEREKTHGSFQRNADCSQHLKELFRTEGCLPSSTVHREALDMIALKLSRILSGQANFKDHWRDLSGYALLAMEACDG